MMAGKRAALGVVCVGRRGRERQQCGLNIKPAPFTETTSNPHTLLYLSMHARAGQGFEFSVIKCFWEVDLCMHLNALVLLLLLLQGLVVAMISSGASPRSKDP